MITATTCTKTPETLVGMGQVEAGSPPQSMKAVVGSCIALVLYHPRLKTGSMAHIVLPDSAGRNGAPGKFADTAVPHMLELLRGLGAPAHGLTAKYAGGADMFGNAGPLHVGDSNAKAVARALQIAGITVIGHDVGGTRGRRVTLDFASGAMTIERPGQQARTL